MSSPPFLPYVPSQLRWLTLHDWNVTLLFSIRGIRPLVCVTHIYFPQSGDSARRNTHEDPSYADIQMIRVIGVRSGGAPLTLACVPLS